MARVGLGTQLKASIPMIKAVRRELLILLVVFLLGTVFGWLALGWGVAPVQWTDAAPVDLQETYREFYLRTLAVAYANGAVTGDDLVRLGRGERWTFDEMLAIVNQLAADPNQASRYRPLIDALNVLRAQAGSATAASESAGAQPSIIQTLGPFLGVVLAAAAVVFLSLVVVRRTSRPAQPQAVSSRAAPTLAGAPAASRVAQPTVWVDEAEAPLRQFDMIYVLGDDRFDMSNAIETPGGMFLGECGMGISETVGTPDPSKVTAFEVWLFDKNDIRTVTSVLMSEHAFKDPTLKAKLAAKGDAVLAQNNGVITLETATLRVRARVTELEYGSGQLPQNSFFQRLRVVMAAWPLGDGGVTQPADVLA